jgi:hypothetical protein
MKSFTCNVCRELSNECVCDPETRKKNMARDASIRRAQAEAGPISPEQAASERARMLYSCQHTLPDGSVCGEYKRYGIYKVQTAHGAKYVCLEHYESHHRTANWVDEHLADTGQHNPNMRPHIRVALENRGKDKQ